MDATLWANMFHLAVPILEKILRPAIVYGFLVVGLRLAGKRELAQLNPFDLIVLLTLSNTVQNAIIGEDNSVTGGLIGAATLLALNYAVVRFLYRHEGLEQLVEGNAELLIDGGRLVPECLERNLISQAELTAAAHRQGFASLDEIDSAVLEPTGTITFVGTKPTPEGTRHAELLDRLEDIRRQLVALRAPGT